MTRIGKSLVVLNAFVGLFVLGLCFSIYYTRLDLKTMAADRQKELADLNKEIATITKENDDLGVFIATQDDELNRKTRDLGNEKERLEQELADLEQSIQQSRASAARAATEFIQAVDNLRQKTSEVVDLREQSDQIRVVIVDLEDKATELRNQIAQATIRLNIVQSRDERMAEQLAARTGE